MNTHRNQILQNVIAGGCLLLLTCGVSAAQEAAPNIGAAALQQKQLLTPESLASFLAPPDRSELERFETLIGKPLREFELEWRDAMLKLSTP